MSFSVACSVLDILSSDSGVYGSPIMAILSSSELWWNAPQTKEVGTEFEDIFASASVTSLNDLVDVLLQECRS